jgi:putative transposase
MLKREAIHVNKKRVHRLYYPEGLQLRLKRTRRNVSGTHRKRDYIPSTRPNKAWAMDLVADQLSTGNKFRILTVVDTYTREHLAAYVGMRLRSKNVVQKPTDNAYIESFNRRGASFQISRVRQKSQDSGKLFE